MRKFEHLNHPEPDEDGVQRYTVYEVFVVDEPAAPIANRRYERVADNLTLDEAEAYITERGEWNE